MAAAPAAAPAAGPLTPTQSQALVRLDPGLRIELVAAEPDVQSPVAAAFDEAGRLWVVEMNDYPQLRVGRAPEGRIKILEDLDRDGRFERVHVFAEGLQMANGILPWRGGAIVTAAPNILFLPDADGDGRADGKQILYEGFAVDNPQLRVSTPTLGPDNWIYVANGQRGGKIRPGGQPSAPAIDIDGLDFRFDPINGRAEAVTGMGQFGLTFDDWGRRFVCTNRNHLIPIVMPNRAFARNPFLAPPPRQRDDQRPGGAARVFPLTRHRTLVAAHVGFFTAACGVTVYRGDLLTGSYPGSVLTCEPTGNLIHREILTPTGASFQGRPAREGAEFLAAADPWFRPVNLAHGPDGALYVVDMYRAEVEHPDWVVADRRNLFQFDGRRDLGRIWRVLPEAAHPVRRTPLVSADTATLVAALEDRNGWWRTTAQRLLLQRKDAAAVAVAPLRHLLASSKVPQARIHAAHLLRSFAALKAEDLLRLLDDQNPRVRENGVELAETVIAGDPAVQAHLLRLARDPDGHVRFRVALALGDWDDDKILRPLASIAAAAPSGKANGGDSWTRTAIVSAVPRRAAALAQLVRDVPLLRELGAVVGARQDAGETEALLVTAATRPDAEALAMLLGLAEGSGRRGVRLGDALAKISSRRALAVATTVLARAAGRAGDRRRPLTDRREAVVLLGHGTLATARPVFERLLDDVANPDLAVAAVQALSALPDDAVPALLLRNWKRQTPAVRREVLEAFARRPERLPLLLDEVEAARIEPGELGATLRKRLLEEGRVDVRARAKALLRRPEDRDQVIERYRPALTLRGDGASGRQVFVKICAACHRIGDVGAVVGPDLSDTVTRGVDALMTDILDPSRAIDANYVSYTVETKSGATLTGFLSAQNASSVTLRRGDNQHDVVLRQDIVAMASSGTSLMPEGLEAAISVQQMADLIAFLRARPE